MFLFSQLTAFISNIIYYQGFFFFYTNVKFCFSILSNLVFFWFIIYEEWSVQINLQRAMVNKLMWYYPTLSARELPLTSTRWYCTQLYKRKGDKLFFLSLYQHCLVDLKLQVYHMCHMGNQHFSLNQTMYCIIHV